MDVCFLNVIRLIINTSTCLGNEIDINIKYTWFIRISRKTDFVFLDHSPQTKCD